MKTFLAINLLQLFGLITACSSTPSAKTSPRETARAAIILLAKTTAITDERCATLAREKQDAQLARVCADAYDVARPALLSAESAVDAWDPAYRGTGGPTNDVACLVSKSAWALAKMVETIRVAGGSGTLPLSVSDSLKFATSIVGECHPASGGASP